MSTSKNITDFTKEEFIQFLNGICNDNYPTEEAHINAVMEFERLTGHPAGSDLIYYPEEGKDSSPEGIVNEVIEWRKANGLPGFKNA